MRRIETKEQMEKKKKRNQMILGAAMIFLLTASVAGYSIMNNASQETSKVTEYGIDFYRQNGMWLAEFGEDTFIFQNLPSEVSSVEVQINLTLGQYYSNPLYFINANQGAPEILNNIGKFILRYQEACLENETCEGNLPIKDCSNNLFIFEAGNETKVYQDENCVYIAGDSVKGADAFLYKVLGII